MRSVNIRDREEWRGGLAWAVLLLATIALVGCTGGTFVHLPNFPDVSCMTCGPGGAELERRPN
jgi:hypothetical protein